MSIIDDIYNGLVNRGISPVSAAGSTAGIMAESGGIYTAVNPSSGAYGLGQWLGSRKTGLISAYGSSPTFDQQLDYIAYELKGGDFGGKYVLSASNPIDALNAYITKFMRPAPGKETTGDLSRGTSVLNKNFSGVNLSGDTINKAASAAPGDVISTILGGILPGFGSTQKVVSDTTNAGVSAVSNALDLNGWFQRGAVLIFALIFIAAAVFAFRGSDIVQMVKAGG